MAEVTYPGLSLYKGCEIMCQKRSMSAIVDNIKNDIFPSLNGTKYVLTEFDPGGTNGMEEMNYCLEYVLDKGFVPVIAHVERYASIYDEPLEDMMRLKEMGCLAQINLYSIEQDQGFVGGGTRKELANLYLQQRLVDFVGTDTHRLDYKSPEAAVGAKALVDKYGYDYAGKVLYENAKSMLM